MHAIIKALLARWRVADVGAEREAVCGERITVRRRQRMREGYVSWPARPAFPPLLCRIEDLSFSGARIAIDGTLPDDSLWSGGARLYVAGDEREFQCRLAWQKPKLFGLRFEGRPLPPSRSYR